ncbi:MAG TPA: molybdopterin-dependent oxidoreductase [Thermoanaerobaculia bacterium]
MATAATAIRRSACPLDCPDACSLDVTVEAGRVRRVEGAADRNPLTAGFICSKVRRLPEHVHGDERVARPHQRVGPKGAGAFAPIGWDEALELVARRLAEVRDRCGGEAILPYSYGGSNGLLTQDTTDALLFRRLGASRLARTVCAAPSGRAAMGLYGKMEGVALGDYEHARLVVVWGMNPHASGIHLVPPIQRARERGARLVVVDPRRIQLAAQADLHLAVRPGSDVAVALAVVRELFASGRADLDFLSAHAVGWEELRARAEPWTIECAAEVAGLAADDLRRFVAVYADSSPAVVRCGWGLERNRNGGSAVAAVLALPAVAGKFGVRGGGYTMSNSAAWKFDASSIAGREPATRRINMNRLGEALTALADPPIEALFVYNSNALATTPNQSLVRRGLEREDLFTVVFDAVWTDTARYADVVLPATTFLEHRELARGYGAYVLHEIEPVIPPVGEARPNYEVFAELAVRTGLARPDEIPSEREAVDRLLDSTGRGRALRDALAAQGYAEPLNGGAPVQFVDVFPRTADRKIHLAPDELDAEAPRGLYAFQPDPATAEFPLALVSPATNRTISSTLGQLRRDPARLAIHPVDAGARSIASGDRVRIWNALGEVVTRARVSDAVRTGVVELPKGLWARHTENGATANALAPDSFTDLGDGACFNDARVEVERLAQ